MPKVFLSYNRKDEAFVQELYRRLKRDGVECFFDKESIQWGENWVLALERGIDECDQFVPVLSPEFCDSEWIAIERTSAMIEDPSGVRGRVRPLLLRECPDRPRFLKPIQHIDVSTTEQFEQNYPKICTALGGALTPDTEPQRGTLPPVRALPAKHRMPHRSLTDRFVGRVEDLWKLHDLLQKELASAEASFEPGHPSIATRQSNLALVLKDLGELEEARDLLRQALASAEASFEPGHPSIATRQSNLALVLKDLGELEEARDLLRQAHQALHEKFGPEHPSTKTVLNNLRGVEGQAAGEG